MSLTTLVTVQLADGRVLRAASSPCEVTSRTLPAQGPWAYTVPLIGEVDLEEELDLVSGDGVAALTQATIELSTTEPLAELAGDWHPLLSASVEVALIDLDADEDWEDRRVILADGVVQAPSVGVVGEPTRLVVESAPSPGGALTGDPERTLDGDYGANTDTTGAAFSELDGYKPVLVIGRCYGVPAFKVDSGGGSNYLCIAGHAFADVSSVEAYEEGVSVGTFTPFVTTAPVSGEDVTELRSAAQFLAADGAYTFDASSGGIAAYDSITEPALMASGVVAKLLALSGVPVDWVGSRDALQRIAAYDVGVWLDEPAEALEVLRSRLLPVLPIIEVQGAEGLRLVSLDAHRRQVQFEAVAGQQLVGRVGGVEWTDFDHVANDFTLRYAYDSYRGDYQSTARLGADQSAICYLSQQLRGVRAMTVETDVVWGGPTASMILRDLADRYALPRRVVRYVAAPDFAARVRPGMVGLLTDAEIGAEGVPCSVMRRRLGAAPELTFVLVDRSPGERP